MTDLHGALVRSGMKTPRAAAIAGIVFSTLLIYSLWLLWVSVSADPLDPASWLKTSSNKVSLALNLIPFAGIAFLWFLGVLRDRLGVMEDRLFATVFLGSGLLFLGMTFVAASAMGGLILAHSAAPGAASDVYPTLLNRAFAFSLMRIYAFRMAAVFMITTSTLVLRTGIAARWIAFLGYAAAALILVGSGLLDWVLAVFPFWVLLLSVYVLFDNLRRSPQPV
ncbi:MAG TPA: hypothetical protein VKI44_13095 [Acetobacteraceae bacterium]|nr:hypothetical protein [Acetobacteraceae bacterium]